MSEDESLKAMHKYCKSPESQREEKPEISILGIDYEAGYIDNGKDSNYY